MNPLGLTSKFFIESAPEKWRDVRAAGFANAELVFRPHVPAEEAVEEAAQRRAHILGAGLALGSAHLPYDGAADVSSLDEANRAAGMALEKRVLDQIGAWEIPIAVLHASYEPVADADRAARLDIARDAIADLGEYARRRGVTLAVEVLPRTCLGNCAREILYLTGEGTLAKVNFDFNHLLKESHFGFIDAVMPHIVTTHLSDYDFVDEKHWMPGIGKIDWPAAVGRLLDAGYGGQLMFETYEQRAVPGMCCTPAMLAEQWARLMGT